MPRYKLILLFSCSVCFTIEVFCQNVVYTNQTAIVYQIPNDLSTENVGQLGDKIAMDLARRGIMKLVGKAVTELSGKIGGLLFSIIQEIPTVGNPLRVEFEVIPQNSLRGYELFNVSILLEAGDSPRGISLDFEKRQRFLKWETIESRDLITESEAYRIPPRCIVVLKRPLGAPNELGVYRISVAGKRREIRVTEVVY